MTAPEKSAGMPRRWSWLALGFAFLLVLMPYLFWRSTWFGRPLSDKDMAEYLAEVEKPRRVQHALAQIVERIERGDDSVRRWYPEVVALVAHPSDEVRTTAAWAMGRDNTEPAFQRTLGELLADPHPMVRRNAALALVRFADDSGRAEILAMLRPWQQPAPAAGRLVHRFRPGDPVNPNAVLGRIEVGAEETVAVRAAIPGTFERWLEAEGAPVARGDPVALIAPEPGMVWEALRALVLIGRPEDIPAIEPYTAPVRDMPQQIAAQARETVRAIRARYPEIE